MWVWSLGSQTRESWTDCLSQSLQISSSPPALSQAMSGESRIPAFSMALYLRSPFSTRHIALTSLPLSHTFNPVPTLTEVMVSPPRPSRTLDRP